MAVLYQKLFNLMRDKKMKRKDLIERAGIIYATIAKLEKGDNVQMEVLKKMDTIGSVLYERLRKKKIYDPKSGVMYEATPETYVEDVYARPID